MKLFCVFLLSCFLSGCISKGSWRQKEEDVSLYLRCFQAEVEQNNSVNGIVIRGVLYNRGKLPICVDLNPGGICRLNGCFDIDDESNCSNKKKRFTLLFPTRALWSIKESITSDIEARTEPFTIDQGSGLVEFMFPFSRQMLQSLSVENKDTFDITLFFDVFRNDHFSLVELHSSVMLHEIMVKTGRNAE